MGASNAEGREAGVRGSRGRLIQCKGKLNSLSMETTAPQGSEVFMPRVQEKPDVEAEAGGGGGRSTFLVVVGQGHRRV